MNDVNATLTRAFAQAAEPADDGFSLRVAEAVRRREKAALWLLGAQGLAFALAAVAIALGAFAVLGAAGPSLSAWFWLEVARAHGAVSQASINLGSWAAGLTPFLFLAGAAAGGALVYRSAQA